jgi:hypothetical protein
MTSRIVVITQKEVTAVFATDGLEVDELVYPDHGYELTRLTAMAALRATLSTFGLSRSIVRLMRRIA